ncbi:PREDICTED: tyrosine aminotransferase-like [Acropora digitifera]|uniref:tyrosine aminotransferase-like n=1 Tax=Acropora digitifera TaxID=70779 RepID=UPI00077AC64C|nr:PREDICTED: tyrosine aminotransferase-like [Acropora digitifera]
MSSAKRRRWHIPASFTARTTFNPIRSIVDRMKISPNPEKQMIALSIGDPSVFGNLDPCNEMVDSVVNCIKKAKHNGYSPSTGYVKTREAIAAEHSYPLSPLTYKDVVLACGCSGALELALDVLLNPGDNVLLPKPGFSIYQTISISRGHEVRHYNLLPERSWEVDIDHLESLVDDRTRAIVVNNPSNPCGSVYTKEHLEAILEGRLSFFLFFSYHYCFKALAQNCDLQCFWVYHKLCTSFLPSFLFPEKVFPGYKFYPLAQLSENVPILTCGGISKGYLVPGWRLGWVIIHDKHGAFESEVRQGLVAMSQQILGPNTLIQGALPDILAKTPQSYFENTVKVIKKNAEICYEALLRIPELKPVMPCGAMYMMVSSV